MSNKFAAQFKRVNESRISRGQPAYPGVTEYLMDQGFSRAEAEDRATASQSRLSSGPKSVAMSDDAAAIYAHMNAGHYQSIYGEGKSNGADDNGRSDDVGHGGRIAGVNSPADYVKHVEEIGKDVASPAAQQDFDRMARDVYAGEANAGCRRATSSETALAST